MIIKISILPAWFCKCSLFCMVPENVAKNLAMHEFDWLIKKPQVLNVFNKTI